MNLEDQNEALELRLEVAMHERAQLMEAILGTDHQPVLGSGNISMWLDEAVRARDYGYRWTRYCGKKKAADALKSKALRAVARAIRAEGRKLRGATLHIVGGRS